MGDRVEGQIFFISKQKAVINNEIVHKTNNALHMDYVQAHRINGKLVVKKVKSRYKTEFIGILKVNKNITFVTPIDTKVFVDFYISGVHKEYHNHKVLVKLIEWVGKSPKVEILKSFGHSGDLNSELLSIVAEGDISEEFPLEVYEELKYINSEVIIDEGRIDYRNTLTLTIDPFDAKDYDDALSIKYLDDDKLEIGIHIADVSHFIHQDTILDTEARKRGNSTYLVDRVIPMLPELLSNDICSLLPNQDRLVYSILFTIDKKGNIHNKKICRMAINSDIRLSYEDAQDLLDSNKTDEITLALKSLNNIAKIIRENRLSKGGLKINKKEVKISIDGGKKPTGVIIKEARDSNKLIEEFMLLANKYVAKHIKDNIGYCINRIHEEPNDELLQELSSISKQFGYDYIYTNDRGENTKRLNILIESVKDTPEENIINNLIIRLQSKARYSTSDIGHFGLGFGDYCHFTSPIRRYADIMVHRLLSSIKMLESEQICNHISNTELKSLKAERDSIKLMQSILLKSNIGNVYKGTITNITNWGIYVEIDEYLCDGLIRFDKSSMLIVSDFSILVDGILLKIGDSVRVIVCGVNIEKRQINLGLFT